MRGRSLSTTLSAALLWVAARPVRGTYEGVDDGWFVADEATLMGRLPTAADRARDGQMSEALSCTFSLNAAGYGQSRQSCQVACKRACGAPATSVVSWAEELATCPSGAGARQSCVVPQGLRVEPRIVYEQTDETSLWSLSAESYATSGAFQYDVPGTEAELKSRVVRKVVEYEPLDFYLTGNPFHLVYSAIQLSNRVSMPGSCSYFHLARKVPDYITSKLSPDFQMNSVRAGGNYYLHDSARGVMDGACRAPQLLEPRPLGILQGQNFTAGDRFRPATDIHALIQQHYLRQVIDAGGFLTANGDSVINDLDHYQPVPAPITAHTRLYFEATKSSNSENDNEGGGEGEGDNTGRSIGTDQGRGSAGRESNLAEGRGVKRVLSAAPAPGRAGGSARARAATTEFAGQYASHVLTSDFVVDPAGGDKMGDTKYSLELMSAFNWHTMTVPSCARRTDCNSCTINARCAWCDMSLAGLDHPMLERPGGWFSMVRPNQDPSGSSCGVPPLACAMMGGTPVVDRCRPL